MQFVKSYLEGRRTGGINKPCTILKVKRITTYSTNPYFILEAFRTCFFNTRLRNDKYIVILRPYKASETIDV